MQGASAVVVDNNHHVSSWSPGASSDERIPARRRFDQRRSPRVELVKPLPCFPTGLGRAAIVAVSLGGVTLVSSFRAPADTRCDVRLLYGDTCVDTKISIYRSVLHELFYSDELGSRVSYASSATFVDPSVATLNLMYRIIGDHWVDTGDDDTTPFES